MRAGVIAQREVQDVLEIVGEHQVAAAVRQPVGEPGNQRAGDDGEQSESRPRRRPAARASVPAGAYAAGSGAGQSVDDAAEQDRLDE